MEPVQKTIFVLDHSPAFTSVGQVFGEPWLKGTKKPLKKSLWTCSLEMSLEYRRVILDSFCGGFYDHGSSFYGCGTSLNQPLFRLVVSDSAGRFVSPDWTDESISLESMLNSLALIGAPETFAEQSNCSILNGISLAVEALIQATKIQIELKKKGQTVENRGRIIVVTKASAQEFQAIEEHIVELIDSQNRLALTLSGNFLPISAADLCIINVGSDVNIFKQINSVLSCDHVACPENGEVLSKMCYDLAEKHFWLNRTIVSGIPMKEEQSTSGASSNYDVELLHDASIHREFLPNKDKEACTLTLKWCNPVPKTGLEPQYATKFACPVTPLDVTSRPSACLTSFVLSGRSVLLECQTSNYKGKKYMLTCHNGIIFLHSLHHGPQSLMENLSSISETIGGRVADYRITQFSDVIKETWLRYNDQDNNALDHVANNLEHICKITPNFPLILSDSIIFNLTSKLEPLLTLLKKDKLNDTEIFQCKKILFNLSKFENSGDVLTTSTSHIPKLKGLKREEQFLKMWEELEQYVRNYSHFSTAHHAVLNCLLQCINKKLEPFQQPAQQPGKRTAESPGIDQIPQKRLKSIEVEEKQPETMDKMMTLLQLWLPAYQRRWSGWRDFEGRLKCGQKAVLYPELMKQLETKDQQLL